MAWSCISVVLLGWAWLGVLASGHSVRQDVVSDPRAIAARHPFALLQTGARQSFCQVMILSENSGVAAASCFDYVGHQVDMRMDYSVVVGGAGTEITAQALVQSVIVHPDYDPETFLNNIAVLKFDSVNLANLYPNVGANTQEWNRLVFVHRTLFEDSSQWNDYNVYTDGQESQMCVNVEPFRQSYKDWACGGIIANSPYGDSCDVPYKMIIGQTENESAMLGFYSHSELVPGDMFCKPNGVHWFVMVANYIPWINNQGLEQGVSAITLTPGAQIATDVAYKHENSYYN
ncbi:hypothetical protein GGF46_003425 [Coemansia sp. RSA 552]|nr:hypothetical protein GGF46_003425 [Coemansia sp. RSA 552]